MIDFRYHVVSIVAVFLALALGLFIGSTSLRGTVASDLDKRTKGVNKENGVLHGQISQLQSQLNDDHSFETATEPYLVGGRLTGDSVVVVSAPGVDGGMRGRVVDALTAAGATVSGDIRLQDALFDPQQEQFLSTLVSQVQLPGRTLPTGSGTQRALALLADVLGTKPQAQSISAAAQARVLSAYSDGKLLRVSGGTAHAGSLALLLTAAPPANADPKAAQTQQTLFLDLAHDLDRSAVGAVIAGPATATQAGGMLAAARDDKNLQTSVSTVDTADQPSGVIATVLALEEQASGGVGSYGSGAGASAPVPTPSPT